MEASATGIIRASASMNAIESSATLMLLAPGAFMTTMPRSVAVGTSTLSTPVPARAMTFNCGRRSQQRRGNLRGAPDDERVGVGEIPGEFFGRSSGSSINGPSWNAAKQFDGR